MARPTRPSDFRPDDRGAFMVMGIFMSLFLVAALWSIAGTGEAVLFRERLQEASDAAALGAASIDARAMNLIVLFNIVAASIMSVRVAMIAMLVIGGAAGFPPPAGSPIQTGNSITPVTTYVPLPAFKPLAAPTKTQLYDRYNEGIGTAIHALDTAQRTVLTSAPGAASKNAVDMTLRYEPIVDSAATVTEGTPVGAGGSLPTLEVGPQLQNDGELCREASELAFPSIPPPLFQPDPPVAPLLTGLMSAIGSTLEPADVWKQIIDSGAWYECQLDKGGPPLSSAITQSNAQPGYPDTQIFTTVGARGSGPSMGAALVNLAAQGRATTPAPSLARNAAFSEAEFFFDCPNVWPFACSDYADWTVSWATRLRLFNVASARNATIPANDLADALAASGSLLQSNLAADVAAGTPTPLNAQMLVDLAAAESNQMPLLH